MKTIREVSSYFHDVKWTDGGSGFKAKCPHHDDNKASLHVKEDNGKKMQDTSACIFRANLIGERFRLWQSGQT